MDGLAIKEPRRSERLGIVKDPGKFFEDEKRRILDKIGDISDLSPTLNRILIAVWTPEKGITGASGIELLLPDKTKDEDFYQCSAGLVLKLGVQAYNPQPGSALVFFGPDKCQPGDWVMFRRGEGVSLNLWRHPCYLMGSERGIWMNLGQRPDAVY